MKELQEWKAKKQKLDSIDYKVVEQSCATPEGKSRGLEQVSFFPNDANPDKTAFAIVPHPRLTDAFMLTVLSEGVPKTEAPERVGKRTEYGTVFPTPSAKEAFDRIYPHIVGPKERDAQPVFDNAGVAKLEATIEKVVHARPFRNQGLDYYGNNL